MCNRYTPSSLEAPHFKTWLALNPTNYPPEPWRRLGPAQLGPFFRPVGENHEVAGVVGRWGMIRPGAPTQQEYKKRTVMRKGVEKVIQEPLMTNNARIETVATKSTFRKAWADNQRCIIPALEFDEPCWETMKNEWWVFRRADGQPWGLAGIWSEWTDPDTGEVVPNYTMLTRNADDHPLMNRMHRPEYDAAGDLKVPQDKRSVVPLDPADWTTWLWGSKERALDLITLPQVAVYDAGPELGRRLPRESSPLRREPPQGGLF